jgi:hypothetical protein
MISKKPSNRPLPASPDGATKPPLRLGTTREACLYGRFGHTLLYALINAGRIDAYKRGTRTMIDLDSIDRMHAAMPKIAPRSAPPSPPHPTSRRTRARSKSKR